jgi:hypothetical protein
VASMVHKKGFPAQCRAGGEVIRAVLCYAVLCCAADYNFDHPDAFDHAGLLQCLKDLKVVGGVFAVGWETKTLHRGMKMQLACTAYTSSNSNGGEVLLAQSFASQGLTSLQAVGPVPLNTSPKLQLLSALQLLQHQSHHHAAA